ncbi:MAG: hypothetical protein ABI855_20885 [Bacteroidota bacterium]
MQKEIKPEIITIGPNRYQLYAKIILPALFIFIPILLLAIPGININFFLLIFLTGIWLLCFLITIIQLVFLPVGVVIDKISNYLVIKFFFSKPQTIQLSEIQYCSATSISGESTSYEGLFIYIKTGEKILLSTNNLKEYKPILFFLKKSKVKYRGEEEFRFMAYYLQGLKYFLTNKNPDKVQNVKL